MLNRDVLMKYVYFLNQVIDPRVNRLDSIDQLI